METLCRCDIVDIDVTKSLVRSYVGKVLATGDKNANKFGVNVYRAGVPVDVSGYTVLGHFIRPDMDTLPITGAVEGNTAYVVLPSACYTAEGAFSLTIKISGADITQTVRVVDGHIRLTQTDNIVDPGEVVPSLDELFAKIADMEAATAETKQATADAEEAARKVTQAAESIAPAIHQTATGGVAHMVDAAARPALSHVTEIIAVQTGSGDPSPDNIRPITGFDAVTINHSGRNMLDVDALERVEINPGEIRWGKRYTRPGAYAISASVAGGDSDYIYAKVVDGAGATVGSTMYLVAGSTIKSYDVALTAGQALVVWYVRDLDEETVKECMLRTQIQVEIGSKSAYEVGKIASQTAALPETVIGGTLDWSTGVLTVTHKHLQLTGIFTKGVTNIAGYVGAVVGMKDMKLNSGSNGLCDVMKPIEKPGTDYIKGASVCFGFSSAGNTMYAFLPESMLADNTLATFNAYFDANPANIVYPLADPYTIQLDPQTMDMLKGSNNVWTDAGDTAITYIADTQIYIDNKFTELQNAILAQGADI